MQPVSNKVAIGAASAASVSTPGIILLWLMALAGVPGITMPSPEIIGMAVGSGAGAAVGLIVAYIKREFNLPNGEAK